MERRVAERFAAELDETIMEFVRIGTQYARRRGAPTRSQLILMQVLQRQGPIRTSDLASAMDVTSPAVSNMVSELEDLGYACRTQDPTDRRATLVTLTHEGRHKLEEALTERRERVVELLLNFSPTEIETFLGTLKSMSKLLSARHDS